MPKFAGQPLVLASIAFAILSRSVSAQVCTSTSLLYGISPPVTDLDSFQSFTSAIEPHAASATGSQIPYYSEELNPTSTATVYAQSDAIVKAGYTVTSEVETVTGPCSDDTATITRSPTSKTLPPSPTGSINCSPHGDHWHCDPAPSTAPGDHSEDTLPPSPTGSICSPHGDHWDCVPSTTAGGSGKTVAPETPAEPSPTGKNCHAHGDHWHCDGDEDEDHDDDHDDEEHDDASGSASATAPVETSDSAAPGTLAPRFLKSGIVAFAFVFLAGAL